MNGVIGIEGHRILCVIGVYSEERLTEQEIFVDLEVETSFDACATSDRIEDTVSYADLADTCTSVALGRQYNLLEAYAVDVLDLLLKTFPIHWARIRVKKPKAMDSVKVAFVELKQFSKRS